VASNKSFLALLLLSACSLSPDLQQPDMSVPAAYKEQEVAKGVWKEAAPLEAADRGKWWKIFGDSELDQLEEQAIAANQNLKAAAARVEQSRAIVRANAVSFLPDIDLGANAVRAKSSNASVAAFGGAPIDMKPYTLYSAGGTLSYEADLFGRVRDNEKAFSFEADAQEATYRSALLALQADVATQYFRLRAADAEKALLEETVKIRTEAQRIMQRRMDVGSVSSIDYTRTQADLSSAKAELANVERQRATLENAMAILLGKNPSEYHFAEMNDALVAPPLVPAGIPSTLLQRRPDIANAQALMAAANRRIGVARTAFFPRLLLTASGGFESLELSDIFKWSSKSWALGQQAGSALTMTLFDSGRTAANVDVAHARYAEALANYQQQVLVAFGDVENSLSDQRLLAEQSVQVDAAADASSRTTHLLQRNYDEGEVTYFEFVDAQRSSLAAGRASIQTRGARLVATVALVRALGGDWQGEAAAAEPVLPVEPVITEPKEEPVVSEPTQPEAKPEHVLKLPEDYKSPELPEEPKQKYLLTLPENYNQVTLPE